MSVQGCWDNDFVFPDGSKNGESKSAVGMSQTSGTVEDWDVEILMEKDGDLSGKKSDLTSAAESDESDTDDYEDGESIMSSLFSYDKKKPEHRLESLLEYLDGHNNEPARTVILRQRQQPFARPPTLFSVYRRPGCHHYFRNTALQIKNDVALLPCDIDGTCTRCGSQHYVPDQNLSKPSLSILDCGRHHRRALRAASSPHAPESPQGFVAWLVNLRAKVRTTRAVVARPPPILVGDRECERQPSEELALERRLRSVEMVFCSAVAVIELVSAAHMVKSLLQCLDNVRHTRGATSSFRALISLGEPCPVETDVEARTAQCAARLVRLTCRVAQRCDEEVVADNARIDAADVSTLRRCGLALVDEVHNFAVRWHAELVVHEGVAHLALLHSRGQQHSHLCLRRKNCWCPALPPLPRAAFSKITCKTGAFPSKNGIVDELEATALADMLLDAEGYSPLTCEQLLNDEDTPFGGSFTNNDENKVSTTRLRRVRMAETDIEVHPLTSPKVVEIKLAALIRVLPATSMARAKAALALGVCHLRGGERLTCSTLGYTPPGGSNPLPCLDVVSTTSEPGTSSPGRVAKNAAHHCFGYTSIPTGKHPAPLAVALASQNKHQLNHLSHHAAQTELRVAEMLLFEATCVVEQHTTMQPLDLPVYACQYGSDLTTDACTGGRKPATSYSALVCSIGFTALRSLARVLDRRSKHVYAALALEVCVAILELRDDRIGRCRLQRELAIVSARQSDCDCPRYCLRVLRDTDDTLEAQLVWLRSWQKSNEIRLDPADFSRCIDRSHRSEGIESISVCRAHLLENAGSAAPTRAISGNKLRFVESTALQFHQHAIASASVHEIIFATDLAVSRNREMLRSEDRTEAILIELVRRLDRRLDLTRFRSVSALELEAVLDRISLGLAKLALNSVHPAEAEAVLGACLATGRKCSTVRRVSILSWIVKARLEAGDSGGCRVALARMRRLRTIHATLRSRQHYFAFAPTARKRFVLYERGALGCNSNRLPEVPVVRAAEEHLVGVGSAMHSCLLRYCGPKHDIGEIAASCDLANGNPLCALRRLAPTVAAVEGVVSRVGTHEGLLELSRLYHLRGVAQEAVSRSACPSKDFPLRLSNATRPSSVPSRDFPVRATSAVGGADTNIRYDRGIPETNGTKALWSSLHTVSVDVKCTSVITRTRTNYSGLKPCGAALALREARPGSLPNKRGASFVSELTAASETGSMKQGVSGEKIVVESSTPLADQRCRESRAGRYPMEVKVLDNANQYQPQFFQDDATSKRHRRRRLLRSRHYRAYFNPNELALDSLRWYRHALECSKARYDDFGVATSASAFARLQLERVIAPVAFERVSLPAASEALLVTESSQRTQARVINGKNRRLFDDVDAAARCALSLGALACEPLLLLETYLNVAEARLVRRDQLAAIAHWWEARELFLRLFVVGKSIPLVEVCCNNQLIVGFIRMFLERLLRFLAACDRTMINENLLLFDVFLAFERDARIANLVCTVSSSNLVRNSKLREQLSYTRGKKLGGSTDESCEVSSMCFASSHTFASSCKARWPNPLAPLGKRLGLSPVRASSCVHDALQCFARVFTDVASHRRRAPFSRLRDLQDRNRTTLRVLASGMHALRTLSNVSLITHQETGPGNGAVLGTTVYALHVASTLILYCPLTGARHAVAFGRGAHRLTTYSELNPSNPFVALSAATASTENDQSFGEDCQACNSDTKGLFFLPHPVRCGLSPKAKPLVIALNADRHLPLGKVSQKPRSHWSDWCEYSICNNLEAPEKSQTTAYKPQHKEINERKDAIAAIVKDIAVFPATFRKLTCSQSCSAAGLACRWPRPLLIRLVCSERAQLLPWECVAGEHVHLTRVLHCRVYSLNCRNDDASLYHDKKRQQLKLAFGTTSAAALNKPSLGDHDFSDGNFEWHAANRGRSSCTAVLLAHSNPTIKSGCGVLEMDYASSKRLVMDLVADLCCNDSSLESAAFSREYGLNPVDGPRDVPSIFCPNAKYTTKKRLRLSKKRSRRTRAFLECVSKATTVKATNMFTSEIKHLACKVLVSDLASLHFLMTSVKTYKDDVPRVPVLFVPAQCFNAVMAEIDAFVCALTFHYKKNPNRCTVLGDDIYPPDNSTVFGSGALGKDDGMLPAFAHAMSIKYAAPVIHASIPQMAAAELNPGTS